MSPEEKFVDLIAWVFTLENLNFQETVDLAQSKGFDLKPEAFVEALSARKDELPAWLQEKVKDLKSTGGWED